MAMSKYDVPPSPSVGADDRSNFRYPSGGGLGPEVGDDVSFLHGAEDACLFRKSQPLLTACLAYGLMRSWRRNSAA